MNFFKVIILLIAFQEFQAQNLSARVVDEKNEPLVGATVYLDGTTRGTLTNISGFFKIEKSQNIPKPILVISYLGYQTIYETDIQNLKKVYKLKPKAENLDIVDLYASPFTREEMLEVFKNNFLGSGKPARMCKILNIDDVIVYFVVKENSLYATSANPIVVQNDYLGYRVRFDLKGFQVKFNAKSLEDKYLNQSFYAGFSFFEDTKFKSIKRRKKTYQSSLNNFFKSLIDDDLDNTSFRVGYKGFATKPYSVFELKKLEENVFKVNLKSNFIKTFNDKYIPTKITLKHKSDLSTLKFRKPYFRVSGYGNIIDIENILVIGDLSQSKVAEMLPVNFSVED